MIWIPFAGAISEGIGMILEKKVLKKKKIHYKDYLVFSFFVIVLVMLPLLYFFWKVESQAFEFQNIMIFVFVIASSIFANLLIFYSLKWEKVTELEPIRLLQPLFVILLAFMIYSFEREIKFSIVIVALVASGALLFSHIRRHHLQFNKYLIAALFGSLFFALELVASRAILPYYSGLSFYFIRCGFIFLICFVLFKTGFGNIYNKSKILILITGAIWVFYRLILYYGYLNYGIIFTTLLFILSPVFIYLFARIFLKEKLTWRNIVATIVIVVCVGYALFVGA